MNNSEKRTFPRKNVEIRAVVSDRNFSKPYNCIVCDASRSGCRFKSDCLDEIPDAVYIHAEGMKQPIKGRIVWRRITMAGVEFIWDRPPEAVERKENKPDRTKLSAIISDRHGELNLKCSVHNLSVSGCMAVAGHIDALPEEVCIKLEGIDAPFNAKIVWRDCGMAGLSFLWNAAIDQPDNAKPVATPAGDVLELSSDQKLS